VLTITAGADVRSLTVFVGTPPPSQTPISFARAVGLAIPQAASAGQLISGETQTFTTTVQVISAPNGGATPLAVSVASSNPSVATAVATAVQPGQQTAALTVTTGTTGTAVLTLTAGTSIRSVTVIVGTLPANQTPVVFAPEVGVVAPDTTPLAGQASAAPGTSTSIGIVLLSSPAAAPTTVTVTSSDPGIAQVDTPSVVIPTGGRVAQIGITSGAAGTATLSLEIDGARQRYRFVSGSPGTQTPVSMAPAVGIAVPQGTGSNGGRVIAAAGTPLTPTLGVQLLTAPNPQAVAVTVTTSNPSIVTLGASSSIQVTLEAGSLVVPVTFGTTGVEGAALLTFTFDGVTRELLVIVGNPPTSALPAVVAPVVGVQVP
jgi:hypothetical protein